jgi:hypothetical protein
MRKLFLLLPVLLLLVGCSSEWNGEVRFKVRRIGEVTSGPLISLDVDGEAPKGSYGLITTGTAKPDQLPADIKPGELVVCQVRQYDDNGFDDVDPKTTVGPCRRA